MRVSSSENFNTVKEEIMKYVEIFLILLDICNVLLFFGNNVVGKCAIIFILISLFQLCIKYEEELQYYIFNVTTDVIKMNRTVQ